MFVCKCKRALCKCMYLNKCMHACIIYALWYVYVAVCAYIYIYIYIYIYTNIHPLRLSLNIRIFKYLYVYITACFMTTHETCISLRFDCDSLCRSDRHNLGKHGGRAGCHCRSKIDSLGPCDSHANMRRFVLVRFENKYNSESMRMYSGPKSTP